MTAADEAIHCGYEIPHRPHCDLSPETHHPLFLFSREPAACPPPCRIPIWYVFPVKPPHIEVVRKHIWLLFSVTLADENIRRLNINKLMLSTTTPTTTTRRLSLLAQLQASSLHQLFSCFWLFGSCGVAVLQ